MSANACGDIRSEAAELIASAAQAGVERPWEILDLSPGEIEWFFRSLAARRQAELEKIDTLAYLAGSYVLTAFHAPRRYPRRPDAVAHPPKKMTDKQMKQFFADLSAGKGAENGDR